MWQLALGCMKNGSYVAKKNWLRMHLATLLWYVIFQSIYNFFDSIRHYKLTGLKICYLNNLDERCPAHPAYTLIL